MMKDTQTNIAEKNVFETDKLFNFRPIFFSAIFLCLGICFAYGHILYDLSALWLLCFIPVIILPFLFCNSLKVLEKRAFALFVLALSFAIGGFLFSAQVNDFQSATKYKGNSYAIGKVVNISENGSAGLLTLEDLIIGGNEAEGRMIAYMPLSFCENIRLSDKILVRGYVSTNTACFNHFGFRAGDIDENIRYTLSVEENTGLNEPKNLLILEHTFDAFLWARTKMTEAAYAGMDETSAAVTVAVLVGDRTGIEKGLYDNMRFGGIAHIFAVSGLHVGSMFGFCILIFENKKHKFGNKFLRFMLTAGLLIGYAGICGFSPSVMRATIICLIAYAGKLTGLSTDFLQSIGLSAILILCISPVTLMEAGFQLSYLACLGLALLTRPIRLALDTATCKIRDLFPKQLTKAQILAIENEDTLPPSLIERFRRMSISFLSASLAAQIFTSPVLLSTYGYLSGWSLLLNCLFVPLISAGFSLLLLFVAVAAFLPQAVSFVVLYLPNVVWSGLLLIFEAMDFSSFALSGVEMSTGMFGAYYAGCLFLTDKWNVSKTFKRRIAALCFFVFVLTAFLSNL